MFDEQIRFFIYIINYRVVSKVEEENTQEENTRKRRRKIPRIVGRTDKYRKSLEYEENIQAICIRP